MHTRWDMEAQILTIFQPISVMPNFTFESWRFYHQGTVQCRPRDFYFITIIILLFLCSFKNCIHTTGPSLLFSFTSNCFTSPSRSTRLFYSDSFWYWKWSNSFRLVIASTSMKVRLVGGKKPPLKYSAIHGTDEHCISGCWTWILTKTNIYTKQPTLKH